MKLQAIDIVFGILTLAALIYFVSILIRNPGTISYIGLLSSNKDTRKKTRTAILKMAVIVFIWIILFVIWMAVRQNGN